MENQQETAAQDALKTMAITQAASSYQWAEAIPADVRPIILQTKVKQTLEQLNATLEVVNGEVQIHHKDNPGMQVYDEAAGKLTMQEVVSRALGVQQPVTKKDGPFYQRLSDEQYTKAGVTHTKSGNMTYIDPVENRHANRQVQARNVEEHIAQLNKELDIRP